MGLMDGFMNALGNAGNAAELAQHLPALKEELLAHLQSGDGKGLQELMDKLKGSGLEGQLSSWLGNGGNQAVDASQITHALGEQFIQKIADRTGIPSDKVAAGIALVLPVIVDKLSPNGNLPASGMLGQALSGLKDLKF